MNLVEKIKAYKDHILQFIKFNIVGIMNTAVDFTIFTLLIYLSLHHMISQVISYSCGVVNSYLWNKFWTFKAPAAPTAEEPGSAETGSPEEKSGSLKKVSRYLKKKGFNRSEALKFVVVNIVSLGVSLLFLYIFRDKVGLHVMVSKLIATLFAVVVNFAGNKFWVFRG
ncbi:MAG: GtrA family protein [Candidatus Aminicenantes bacterium]|nr:GtrA family protein [Candidatus Aminicenantes bacterium]